MAWLSSFPSEVAICRNRNRDGKGEPKKENGFKRDLGVATIVILENYGKP